RRQDVTGAVAERVLDRVGITANKNTIPHDPRSPFDPSGLRLGTPAITTRGMKEPEMRRMADWIADAIRHRTQDAALTRLREEVRELARSFPPPDDRA
ncbi:MAG: serine hydroxymethyltransferase, partial [bacterium]|nr:serine hydroxymethyltransferase [bacterium]